MPQLTPEEEAMACGCSCMEAEKATYTLIRCANALGAAVIGAPTIADFPHTLIEAGDRMRADGANGIVEV